MEDSSTLPQNELSFEDILWNIQKIADPVERLQAKKRARQQLKDKLKKIDSKIERLETQENQDLADDGTSFHASKKKKTLKTSESPKRLPGAQKKFDILSYGEPYIPSADEPGVNQGWADRFYWSNDGVYLPFPLGYKARRYVHGIEHVMEIQKDKSSSTPVFYVHIRRRDFLAHLESEEEGFDETGDTIPSDLLASLPETTEVSDKYVSFYNKTSSGVWQSVVDFWNQQFRKTNSKHRVSGPLYFGFKEQFVKDQLYQIMKNVSQLIPEKLRTKLLAQHVRIPPPLAITTR